MVNTFSCLLKTFIKYVCVFVVFLFVCGLVFFYIEECSSLSKQKLMHKPKDARNYTRICEEISSKLIMNLNKTGKINASNVVGVLAECETTLRSQFGINIKRRCKAEWEIVREWIKFAYSSVLTIGNAEVFPRSQAARGFLIGYILIGTPLSFIVYYYFGKLFRQTMRHFISHWYKFFHRNSHDGQLRAQVLFLELLSLSIILIICTALTTSQGTQDWTLLDNVYYWISTFSTVGLGDLSLSSEFYNHKPSVGLVVDTLTFIEIGILCSILQTVISWKNSNANKDHHYPLSSPSEQREGSDAPKPSIRRESKVTGHVEMDSLVILVHDDQRPRC